MIGIYFHDIV